VLFRSASRCCFSCAGSCIVMTRPAGSVDGTRTRRGAGWVRAPGGPAGQCPIVTIFRRFRGTPSLPAGVQGTNSRFFPAAGFKLRAAPADSKSMVRSAHKITPAPEPPAEAPPRALRVLLVEDCEDDAYLLAR